MQRHTSTTNTILQNEVAYDFGPVRIMTSAGHSSIMFYIRPEFHLIAMIPNILGDYYFSNGSITFILANGTNMYRVNVPRNPFSFWIPAGVLTNTLAPVLPVVNAPSFALSTPHVLWNWTYPVINHIPRSADVNHRTNHMPLPLHPTNLDMDLLTLHDQPENVNTGLSREVIFARMKCINYQSTERSITGNDACCICLDDFSDGQIIGSTDCLHTFHYDCISQWLMQHNSCPLCRRIALAN